MDESIITSSNTCHSLKKRKNQQNSCYLCEDLIAEIIRRLPLRSLIRFRFVSKFWFSRISSYNFRLLALQSAKNPQEVIFRHRVRYIDHGVGVTYTLDPDDYYMGLNSVNISSKGLKIVGSCNGIICVTVKKGEQVSCSLWNPSIRRKISIPSHPCGSVTFGFGFDPIIDDYKVVSIPLSKCKGIKEKIFLYTMKANSWNVIASFPKTLSYKKVRSSALFVNGALHWVVDNVILKFNLSTHAFGTIPFPRHQNYYAFRGEIQLAVIEGSLALMTFNGLEIWVRKETDTVASWSKLPEGKEISTEGFESYNPETGVRTRLVRRPDSEVIEMDMCVESLELSANEAR